MNMQKWEYKLVATQLSEQEINKLGEEGWELIQVTHEGFSRAMYFKRPKIDGLRV
jgi:hypothetical protein